MKKATVAILFLLSFCSAIAAMWGFAVERAARGIIADFKISYYGARCLVQNRDPYSEIQAKTAYVADTKGHSPTSAGLNETP